MADRRNPVTRNRASFQRIKRWRGPAAAVVLVLSVIVGITTTSGVAGASSVSNVSVSISDPSSAAGALTSYVVTFTATSALSGDNNDFATIGLPVGTGLSSLTTSTLFDGATQVGNCQNNISNTVTCDVSGGYTVNAGDELVATLSGVVNPGAGAKSLTISTSSDTTPVTSPTYTVTAAQGVSNLGVTINTPTSAAGGLTDYVIAFNTSTTGALNGLTGSAITLTMPANTGLSSIATSTLFDGATQVGYCLDTTSNTVVCYVNSGDTVNAGDELVATLSGVVNPGAGAKSLTVSTSSDTATTTTSYMVTSAQSVSEVGVAISTPTSAAGGLTSYAVTFTASSTGELDGDIGSTVTLTLPANTGLASFSSGTLDYGAAQVGDCGDTNTSVVTCYLYSDETIYPGDTLVAALNGVTNPGTAGARSLAVATSSDTATATSRTYTVTPPTAVSGTAVTVSKTLVSATNVTYNISFKATAGLSGAVGSMIRVMLPTGTSLASLSSASLYDGAVQIGNYCSATTTTVTLCLDGGYSASSGDPLKVVLTGVKNPASTKAYSLSVTTGSNVVASAATYCIATTKAPCVARITPDPAAAKKVVTLTGLNLTKATVTFYNGKKATLTMDTATRIVTKVPLGAKSGPVKVTTSGGSVTLSFTV
jgi:hypothetical protein